jgi:hypothetical protein
MLWVDYVLDIYLELNLDIEKTTVYVLYVVFLKHLICDAYDVNSFFH